MRIAIATFQVPFVAGGARLLAEDLRAALSEAGHESEIVTMPFRFAPLSELARSMALWEQEDFGCLNNHEPDRVIALTFPAYYLRHPAKVLWLMHQYRPFYDLWESAYSAGLAREPRARALREEVVRKDTERLGALDRRFAISGTVAERLHRYNGLSAEVLYPPPPGAGEFFEAEAQPYIFFPSRLEARKRQRLLLRAMALLRAPVMAVIAGDGPDRAQLEAEVRQLGIDARVRLLGPVSEAEKRVFYAHALGVFFGPYAEDYGYVTLEAMLAAKPVITCVDAGGPTEFVRDGENGFCVEPEPAQVAAAIERLWADQPRARRMGRAGRELFESLGIGWEGVVDRLLG